MNKLAHFLASLGWAGHSKIAPGTVGSVVAMVLAFLITSQHLAVALLVALPLGFWSCHSCLKHDSSQDPQWIVIDELCGQWLTLLLAICLWGNHWLVWLVALLLFRILDILKPFPVSWAERSLKGGIAVMADDLVAALMGGAMLAIMKLLLAYV